MKTLNRTPILYVRNFIFGAEDSLVSTVGLLTGVATAGITGKEIVISGVILICVEAFSMSVGSFLSERATEESFLNYNKQKSKSFLAAIIMFISYFVCGFIPLLPYMLTTTDQAFWLSIVFSSISLFILGLVSAKILKTRILKNALRMLIIGGSAIAIGVIVGIILKS